MFILQKVLFLILYRLLSWIILLLESSTPVFKYIYLQHKRTAESQLKAWLNKKRNLIFHLDVFQIHTIHKSTPSLRCLNLHLSPWLWKEFFKAKHVTGSVVWLQSRLWPLGAQSSNRLLSSYMFSTALAIKWNLFCCLF